MELIFATVIGCTLSFLCGAAAVYMREFLAVPKREKQVNEEQEMDPEMAEQWGEFLNYK